MTAAVRAAAIASLVVATVVAACSAEGEGVAPMPEVHTDVDALLRRVTLPARPQRAWWLAQPLGDASADVPGPTDYLTVAVVELPGEGARLSDADSRLERAPWRAAADRLPEPLRAPLRDALGGELPERCRELMVGSDDGYRQGSVVVVLEGVDDFVIVRYATS